MRRLLCSDVELPHMVVLLVPKDEATWRAFFQQAIVGVTTSWAEGVGALEVLVMEAPLEVVVSRHQRPFLICPFLEVCQRILEQWTTPTMVCLV